MTADPFPLAAMLRAAVLADGRPHAVIAREAWPDAAPGSAETKLTRALRDDRETQPATARAILRACGRRVMLEEV